jgi:hypothetical protein
MKPLARRNTGQGQANHPIQGRMVGMTEPSAPDPLVEIKDTWFGGTQHRAEWWADRASRDVPWLVGQVERVRDLLGRLEWVPDDGIPVCPICGEQQTGTLYWDGPPTAAGGGGMVASAGHADGCELARALGRDRSEADR